MAAARQEAIKELKRKREEKRHETQRIAEEEIVSSPETLACSTQLSYPL